MHRFNSFKTRIILLYLVLAVIPIVAISIISNIINLNTSREIESSLLDYAAAQASENLAIKMAALRKIVAQVVTDPEVIALYPVFEAAQPASSDQAYTRNQLANRFSYFAQTDNYITSIALIANNLDAAVYDRYEADSFQSRWSVEDFRNAFLEFGSDPRSNRIGVVSTVNFDGAPVNANRHVYFTFPAMDFISTRSYGTIVIEVDNDAFNRILGLGADKRQFDIYISPSSCLTDSAGIILTAPDRSLVGTDYASLNSATADSGYAIKTLPVKGTAFNLNLIFDDRALLYRTQQLRSAVLLMTLAITGCFILIVLLIAGRLQRRSSQIAAAISRFRENQQDIDVKIDKNDEILYMIADQFNKMTTEITTLVSELRAKNEHVTAVTDQRRQAEIRALQAQINPHFLYNALDRINWMAIDNDETEISEMLVGLASLLRYSISNIDILVPLNAEIRWMEKYLLIQGKRFDREIVFDCSVYGDAASFPVYKMLLQPLVENSILHGFEARPEGNRIRLDAQIMEDARLRLILSDNGSGIPPALLDTIRSEIVLRRTAPPAGPQHAETGRETGIGISNVIDRLWLYYGSDSDITVESAVGKGTSFILIIPYRDHV